MQRNLEGTDENIQQVKDGMEPVRAGESAACNRRCDARTIILLCKDLAPRLCMSLIIANGEIGREECSPDRVMSSLC